MLELKRELKDKYIEKHLGKTLEFIAEDEENGYFGGYTENYIRVYVKEKPCDKFKVRLTEKYLDGALGEVVK